MLAKREKGPAEAKACSQMMMEEGSGRTRGKNAGWETGYRTGERVGTDAVSVCLQCCVCVCLCVRLSPAQLRAGSSLVGRGREGVGVVPDSDLQLSGSRLFPSNSAWIPHTEPKCQFTALSPAPFP